MSSYNHFGCSWCGGPFNGRNYLGCSSVGSGNEFVYDSNTYSYNETPNFFNQPPQHQFETYSCDSCGASIIFIEFSTSVSCCEYCGGPYDSYDCQSNNQVFDEPYSYNDFDSSEFDQPPQYRINQSPLYDDMSLHEMLIRSTAYLEESTKHQKQSFNEFKISCDNFWSEMKRNKPADTLLMGDEDSSTTPTRKTDQFIEFSVDDLVPIPKESEETLDDDSKCNMLDIYFPTTDVREDDFVTFSNPLFDTSCYDN
nr:hypothetical protein [Tanacetum cinerariifolium]